MRRQIEKLDKKESLDSIKTTLNQILDISLKNEFFKKILINVL